MDLMTADVHMEKVASHIEGQAVDAVQWGYAELVDIIGNALADEAAELAVALIRPDQETICRSETDAPNGDGGLHRHWFHTSPTLGVIWECSYTRDPKRQ